MVKNRWCLQSNLYVNKWIHVYFFSFQFVWIQTRAPKVSNCTLGKYRAWTNLYIFLHSINENLEHFQFKQIIRWCLIDILFFPPRCSGKQLPYNLLLPELKGNLKEKVLISKFNSSISFCLANPNHKLEFVPANPSSQADRKKSWQQEEPYLERCVTMVPTARSWIKVILCSQNSLWVKASHC